MIEYRKKTANKEDILMHLIACKNYFNPPLDQTVDLKEYALKIFNLAITFEAWCDDKLVGLIACYFNDPENVLGYITNVSVMKEYGGNGIASTLMNTCIEYGKTYTFEKISLQVHWKSENAYNIYRYFGFEEDERRTEMILMTNILKTKASS
jgi:ribosomal-protein-alanine N-acetyltransferase